MKTFILILLSILLISVVAADTCNPSSGYNKCFENERTQACNAGGSITAEVQIQAMEPPTYDAANDRYYINYYVDDDGYIYKGNIGSWDSLWDRANCDYNGCYNYDAFLPGGSGSYIIVSGEGNTFNENFIIVAWDKDENSDGCWAQTTHAYGWVGSNKLKLTVECNGNANWECTSWSECVEGIKTRTCTTECGLEQNRPDESVSCTEYDKCQPGETKCEGTDYYTCKEPEPCPPGHFCISVVKYNEWENQGEVDGQCGFVAPEPECSIDSECGASETNTKCANNLVVEDYSLNSCNAGFCDFSEGTNVVETCEFGCSEAECLPRPTITVYNLIDNECISQQIYEDEITENDYRVLWDCEQKQSGEVYRLIDNGCIKTTVSAADIGLNDYETLEECSSKITYAEPLTQWQKIVIYVNKLVNKILSFFS